MNERSEKRLGRRRWLVACTRYGLLGGLGVLSARLAVQSGGVSAREDCKRRPTCSSCGLLAGCRLPQAALAKREGRNNG